MAGFRNPAKELERELKLQLRKDFDRASRSLHTDVQLGAPRDIGTLSNGIELTGRSVTTKVLKVSIVSTAKDNGFDYPSYLNSTSRITPNKAKFLVFEYRGKTVRSKGFNNRHVRWWDKAVNEQTWGAALREAVG